MRLRGRPKWSGRAMCLSVSTSDVRRGGEEKEGEGEREGRRGEREGREKGRKK